MWGENVIVMRRKPKMLSRTNWTEFMRVQPQNVGRSTTRNRPHASCYIKSLKNTPHSMSTLYQATSYQSPKTTPHSISTLYQATSYQSPKTTPHSISTLYQATSYQSPKTAPHSISTLYQATSYQSPKTTPHSLCPYQVAPSMINSHFSGKKPSTL